MQQELEVVNTELSIEQAQTDAEVSKATLAVILNYEPNIKFQLLTQDIAKNVDSVELFENRKQLGSLSEMIKKQSERPDLVGTKLKLQTNDLAVISAKSARFPTLGAGVNWSWSKNGSNDGSHYAALAINAQYNIFDGFRRDEQEQTANFQKKINEIDLRNLELRSRSELQQAVVRFEGVERQLYVAKKAIMVAKVNREAADEKYKAGASNYTDFLIANNQFQNAQINLLNTVFSYRSSLIEVKFQIGE